MIGSGLIATSVAGVPIQNGLTTLNVKNYTFLIYIFFKVYLDTRESCNRRRNSTNNTCN